MFNTRLQTLVPFADDFATVIVDYIDIHYNNYAIFNYESASYNTTDIDPTPTIPSNSNGVFSSTAGLVIDAITGAIDNSASMAGNYVVTYQVGPCDNYLSTTNVEIIDNTLSIDSFKNATFKLFPNPTKSTIQ